MRCDEFRTLFPEIIEGMLPNLMQQEAVAHAETCPDCRKELESHQTIVKTIMMKGLVSLPATLHEKILNDVSQIPGLNIQTPQVLSPRFWHSVSAFAILGGLFVLGVAFSFFFSADLPYQNLSERNSTTVQIVMDIASPTRKTGSESEIIFSDTYQVELSADNAQKRSQISVAAADSDMKVKSQARFVCKGRNDENQIMAAFNKLGPHGGIIELEEGTYNCSGVLSIPSSVVIQGKGQEKTILKFDSSIHAFSLVITRPNVTLRDFTLVGPSIQATSRDAQIIRVNCVP